MTCVFRESRTWIATLGVPVLLGMEPHSSTRKERSRSLPELPRQMPLRYYGHFKPLSRGKERNISSITPYNRGCFSTGGTESINLTGVPGIIKPVSTIRPPPPPLKKKGGVNFRALPGANKLVEHLKNFLILIAHSTPVKIAVESMSNYHRLSRCLSRLNWRTVFSWRASSRSAPTPRTHLIPRERSSTSVTSW